MLEAIMRSLGNNARNTSTLHMAATTLGRNATNDHPWAGNRNIVRRTP